MEITFTVYAVAFWAAIIFTVIGAMLGLMGVWVKGFWDNEVGAKLIITDLIFAGTSVAVAAMTKWLG